MQDSSFLDRRTVDSLRRSTIDKSQIQISLDSTNVTFGGIPIAASTRGREMNRIPRFQWDLFGLATHFQNPPLAVPLEPDIVCCRVHTAGQDILDTTLKGLRTWHRVPNIHHHREADDLRQTVEISDRVSHPPTLQITASSLKRICSDSAQSFHQYRSCQIKELPRFDPYGVAAHGRGRR
jgi:hypothetical protein